jgi:hypothetical protein
VNGRGLQEACVSLWKGIHTFYDEGDTGNLSKGEERIVRKRKMEMSMEEFALIVILVVHGAKVKFRETEQVPHIMGVRVKGNVPNGLGEKLIHGRSCLEG